MSRYQKSKGKHVTTYGAYDANLPCKNKACKSHGKPHPNCRCYGAFAKGGEVSFCSGDRAHQAGCEYFAEGGDAVDPNEVVMDGPEEPAEVPASDVVMDEPGEGAVDPADVVMDAGDDANASLSPADLQAKMVEAAHPEGISSYESPGQQLATVAEGAAQGIAGPLAPLIETKVLGVPAEDITGRQEANPWEHGIAETAALGAGMLTGTGEAGLAAKAAAKAAEMVKLGKVGSAAIKGMITTGVLQGGDEVSKAILGQGNPDDAVSPYLSTGAAALFGGLLGGAGAKASGIVEKRIGSTVLNKAAEYEERLAGIGHAVSGGELEAGASKGFKAGYKFFKDTIPKYLARSAAAAAGIELLGKESGWLAGMLGDEFARPIAEKITNKAGKYIAPTILRWLSQGGQGSMMNMIEYADKVAKGTSMINNTVDALFKAGSQQAVNATKKSDIDKLRSYIDDEGGMAGSLRQEMHDQHGDSQSYAKGGAVDKAPKSSGIHDHDEHIAQNFPEQNMLIQTAKGRISNYLSSARPQKDTPKLIFDDHPDDREQKKNYDKALETAVDPLGVLAHIKNGTIDSDHVKHMNEMYPELTGHLKKKLTERITKDQMEGKKPSYKVRQGLSLMLGTPLSGELTPQNIQAAQAVFASGAKQRQRPDQQEGAEKQEKGSKAALSKSDRAYLTDDQARESRQQRSS